MEGVLSEEPQAASTDITGSSPFDDYMPWSGMEEYNIFTGSAGTVKIKKGDKGFSRTSYDTMVYIPKFWYSIKKDDTIQKQYFYISNGPVDGLEVHPGSDCYVGKYLTGEGYVSKSGVLPLTEITEDDARTKSKARAGAGRGRLSPAT